MNHYRTHISSRNWLAIALSALIALCGIVLSTTVRAAEHGQSVSLSSPSGSAFPTLQGEAAGNYLATLGLYQSLQEAVAAAQYSLHAENGPNAWHADTQRIDYRPASVPRQFRYRPSA